VKAIEFKETGHLSHLRFTDLDKPKAQDGEVLIKILAAGLNKSDTTNVLGLFPYTRSQEYPAETLQASSKMAPRI